MTRSIPFRLNRSGILLALISAGFAGEAAAAAGRVDFATSGVTVAGRDGQQRPLARGAELDSGDTIRTNAQGRAQIRFTDGSYVSLQPNTDFAISDYKYDGRADGSERGFYGLVRGAMRTVTGAIGRVNRSAYRVTTPTATVGIRGTGGVIQVLNDGSTLVIGTSGIWSLTNPAGSIDVPAGVSGLAPTEPNTPPRESNTQPQTSTAPVQPEQPGFVQGEQVNPDGTAVIAPTGPTIKPLLSGPGYALAGGMVIGEGGTHIGGNDGGEGPPSVVDATFNAEGQLTAFTLGGFTTFKLGPTGSHADFGTDGILAWGRWIGEVTEDFGQGLISIPFDERSGFHYVIGMPTPVMPTTGSATYSMIGATRPTDGFSAPGSFAGSLGIDFVKQAVTGKFNVTMGSQGYSWNGSAFVSSSRFTMLNDSRIGSVTGSGGACVSGCSATVNGFFSGASAERAGIQYEVRESSLARRINGAAAFKRD